MDNIRNAGKKPEPARAAQEPFGVHISWDGNFVSADDGSDQIVQMPCRPEEARALAIRLLTDTMDEANRDPDGYAEKIAGGED